MNVTQVEAREVEKAPISERPTRIHDIALEADTQEAAALEAIRKALGLSAIEHDDWDFIAGRVLAELKKAGVVGIAQHVRDVVERALPGGRLRTSQSVSFHLHNDDSITTTEALCISRALSDAYDVEWQMTHFSSNGRFPPFACLKATINDVEVSVFFEETSKEG
ncbi:MAG TPA: hypothetical protein GXX23_02650 [Firmicutes bacterium]|nr:hypothetical protein [Candidatus Fermentithermobacillaceae bacterium]